MPFLPSFDDTTTTTTSGGCERRARARGSRSSLLTATLITSWCSDRERLTSHSLPMIGHSLPMTELDSRVVFRLDEPDASSFHE